MPMIFKRCRIRDPLTKETSLEPACLTLKLTALPRLHICEAHVLCPVALPLEDIACLSWQSQPSIEKSTGPPDGMQAVDHQQDAAEDNLQQRHSGP